MFCRRAPAPQGGSARTDEGHDADADTIPALVRAAGLDVGHATRLQTRLGSFILVAATR